MNANESKYGIRGNQGVFLKQRISGIKYETILAIFGSHKRITPRLHKIDKFQFRVPYILVVLKHLCSSSRRFFEVQLLVRFSHPPIVKTDIFAGFCNRIL
jgi:hypothetical protein